MHRVSKTLLCLALTLCVSALLARAGYAQTVTTGSLTGVVMDQQKGVLPGATVTAVHVPTGTTYEAVTQSDGRYQILNVRVGGPYTITVVMSGFRTETSKDAVVTLGNATEVSFTLPLATVTETVVVTGESPLIDTSRAGAASNISTDVKDLLPTISRSIPDIVRVDPMFNSMGSGAGDGASAVSVAGTSFRYNSLQIDGAVNNDLFGLASSAGAPGGTAETQPISLDAIQEIQLVVSPYDVRQGGFAGGGVNAITKSGSNSFHGSAFYFGRNQNWVGKLNPAYVLPGGSRAVSTFNEKQGGGTIGGPIARNKAFFFFTADYGRRNRPTGYSVSGTGQQFGYQAEIDRVLNDLQTLYNYSPGSNPTDEFIRATNNNKYFMRADFNVAKGHQLTIRDNYITAFNDIGTPSLSTYRMPDNLYRYVSNTNSVVGQLNSTFGTMVNELRVTYTRVRDHREHVYDQPSFPQLNVTIAPSKSVTAGTEQFSARNAIDQDIIELNEALTLVRGSHMFTFGMHDEFLSLKNLFIRDNFGTYSFSSIANFELGLAQQYDHSFSATSDPLQAAQFKVRQWGFYAGDQWRSRSNLTLTYGLRVDIPRYPSKPTANPAAVSNFGYATDVVPNGVQWSPRLGFNWDPKGNGVQQFRGGLGMFTGRPAYVWISNQFGNTGIDFKRIGASFNTSNKIPFVTDPLNQPETVTGASAGSFSNEIDVIDPNFKYPSILRGNFGWDRKLAGGFVGIMEFVWSKTLSDIKYQNLNFVPTTVTGSGGRMFFARKNTAYSDVILLENTSKGYTWNWSYKVTRTFKQGFYFMASYSYGQAKSIMDGTSDQAASNWGNVYVPGNTNDPPLATSNFDPGHRINLSGSYDVPLFKGTKVTLSAFYSGQSGRPFTLTTNRDVNGDNRGTNDLLYIPISPTELTFTGGTYWDFQKFIADDPCLAQYFGEIIPRNACRSPWINTFDGRVDFQIPYKKTKIDITLDVLNMINLINTKNGLIEYMSFGQLSLFQPVPTSVTATAPLTGYNISAITSSTFRKFLRDDLRSRWQLQLGARFRF